VTEFRQVTRQMLRGEAIISNTAFVMAIRVWEPREEICRGMTEKERFIFRRGGPGAERTHGTRAVGGWLFFGLADHQLLSMQK